MEAETGDSWIPGLAGLARNDGRVIFVIPAQAGIQGAWYKMGIVFLSSTAKNLSARPFTEFILSVVEGFREITLVCRSIEV
jgi:hypothetical protein